MKRRMPVLIALVIGILFVLLHFAIELSGTYTGWHTGFPDTHYRLVTDTERTIPGEGTPYFIGEFVEEAEDFHPVCPRSCLRRVLTRLGDLGYTARSGFEYEFFVFKETRV